MEICVGSAQKEGEKKKGTGKAAPLFLLQLQLQVPLGVNHFQTLATVTFPPRTEGDAEEATGRTRSPGFVLARKVSASSEAAGGAGGAGGAAAQNARPAGKYSALEVGHTHRKALWTV